MYQVALETPDVETYCRIRYQTGLSPKSEHAAALGLRGTLFAVLIKAASSGEVVGMGRVVGDGGCFFEVVDIAVLPEHQRKGLGKKIMYEISNYLKDNVPATAYVSLLAHGEAVELYAQCGFLPTAPRLTGMAFVKS